jgi:putative addiction module component (TIGR02574 family)
MNERAKTITEQALALPREEQEAIYRALAESLGLPDLTVDEAWYDETEDRLAACTRGEIASVTIEEMIEARKKR